MDSFIDCTIHRGDMTEFISLGKDVKIYGKCDYVHIYQLYFEEAISKKKKALSYSNCALLSDMSKRCLLN